VRWREYAGIVTMGKEHRLTSSCHRMLMKTTDYLDHFARFKQKENVEAVERLLSAHKELAKFERAQLGTSLVLQEGGSRLGECAWGLIRVIHRKLVLRFGRRSKDPDTESARQDHR
jgi:hypothetical protein